MMTVIAICGWVWTALFGIAVGATDDKRVGIISLALALIGLALAVVAVNA